MRACHDLSEGGLAVAAAEMAFAGGWGMKLDVERAPCDRDAAHDVGLLFSESNTRFLCEVPAEKVEAFCGLLGPAVPYGVLGEVTSDGRLEISRGSNSLISAAIDALKAAWIAPLNW